MGSSTTLAPIYAQYNVDAVFNGHDHAYERTYPIVPNTTNPTSDPTVVAAFDAAAIEAAVNDPGIVRHRGKIVSTVGNASAFLAVQREHGSFSNYLWAFVDGKPRAGRYAASAEVPATTALSEEVSRDLRKRGFRFVGSTIVQSFLQACGVRNDHRRTCFRAAEIAKLGRTT